MELLFIALFMVLMGASSAFISHFIDFCFNENNVFDWYYLFLKEKVEPANIKLFKVMGGCIKCFNFWFSSVIFLLIHLILGIHLIFFIPFIAFSVFTIAKLTDDTNKKELL